MKTLYVIQYEGNPISIAYDKLDIINILNDYTKGTMIQFIPAKTIADNLNGTCLYGTYYYLSDTMDQAVFKVYKSEVKEILGEVDVEKKIYDLCQSECIVDAYGKPTDDGMVIGIRAYNQAIEDNKEKKYTEEDMRKAITQAFLSMGTIDPDKDIQDIETARRVMKSLFNGVEYRVRNGNTNMSNEVTKPASCQTAISGSVCETCKGAGKIFPWEFGQFIECGCQRQTDR